MVAAHPGNFLIAQNPNVARRSTTGLAPERRPEGQGAGVSVGGQAADP